MRATRTALSDSSLEKGLVIGNPVRLSLRRNDRLVDVRMRRARAHQRLDGYGGKTPGDQRGQIAVGSNSRDAELSAHSGIPGYCAPVPAGADQSSHLRILGGNLPPS